MPHLDSATVVNGKLELKGSFGAGTPSVWTRTNNSTPVEHGPYLIASASSDTITCALPSATDISATVFVKINSIKSNSLPWGKLTVYATGPYEVWATNSYSTSQWLYDVDKISCYTKLGEANATMSFAGNYQIYLVATRSLCKVDAIQFPSGLYLGDVPDGSGNTHLPYVYDTDGFLVGSPLDYGDFHNMTGPPDGLTDDVGCPPGFSSGGTYQGFVWGSIVKTD